MNGDIGYEVRVCGCFVERFSGPGALSRADASAREIAKGLEATIQMGHARQAQYVTVDQVVWRRGEIGTDLDWVYFGEKTRYRGEAFNRNGDE